MISKEIGKINLLSFFLKTVSSKKDIWKETWQKISQLFFNSDRPFLTSLIIQSGKKKSKKKDKRCEIILVAQIRSNQRLQ
jgi:hypothetical protein